MVEIQDRLDQIAARMNGLGYGVRLIASLPPLVSDLRELGVSNLEAWLREIKP